MTDKAMNDDSRYEKQVHCAEDDNDFFMLRKADVKKYGESEAIMLTVLRGWLRTNRAEGRNIRDGYVWTYNSARKWADELEFWNEDKVKRLLRELEKKGAIIVGNYNKMKSDRTKWYSMEGFKVTDAKGVSEQKNIAIGNNDNTHSAKTHNEEKQQLTIDQLVESRATPHCANLPDDSGNLPDHYQYINNNKKDLNNITSDVNSDESTPTSVNKNLPALAVKGKGKKTLSAEEKKRRFLEKHPEAIGGAYTPTGTKWGTSEDLAVAKRMYQHCLTLSDTYKEPNWPEWANEVRLARESDGRDHASLIELIEWISKHHWWRTKVLSPAKLRKQYDPLMVQAKDEINKRFAQKKPSAWNTRDSWEKSRAFNEDVVDDILAGKYAGLGTTQSAPDTGDCIDAEYDVKQDPF